jgi:hypothetical protein
MADQESTLVEVEAGEYRFVGYPGPRARPQMMEEPAVTIQKSSSELHANDAAMQLIGRPEWVQILYDPQNNAIGLRPTEATDPLASVRRRDKRRPRTHIFAGRSFTLFHGIDTSVTRRYPAKEVEGLLVVDLNAGVSTTGGQSTKKSAGRESVSESA